MGVETLEDTTYGVAKYTINETNTEPIDQVFTNRMEAGFP